MSTFTIPAVLTILIGVVLIKLLKALILSEKYKGLPNGSKFEWPFVGETVGYLKPHRSNSLGTFLEQHLSRYGRVFRSHLFGYSTIVSCDLELNAFVLQNEGTLFQSSYPKPLHDILGKQAMMLVSGELHRKLRSVAVSFVNSTKSSPDFLACVEKLSLSFVDAWRSKPQLPFFKQAKELTFYLMLKSVASVEAENPVAADILSDFMTFMKGFVSLPLHIPGNSYSKAVKARRRVSSHLKDMIKQREMMMRKGQVMGDFLDKIVEKQTLNDDEKASVLLDLLFGGYETTSGLMALAVYFLAHSPSSLRTLREEHRDLRMGKKKGEPLNWEDYKKMNFTSHVINETLRCGNLVKYLHRKALKDVKFKEYIIPSGWQVLPVMLAAHLDPNLHQNPTQFNPSRWTDLGTGKKVTPFGGGLRFCPGAELGKVETAFFLHHFVLNFGWKTQEEEYPVSCPYLDFNKGLLLEIEQI